MKNAFLTLLSFMVLGVVGFADEPIAPSDKTELFNGQDLNGWSTTLEEPATNVFSVSESVIRVAGMPFGYLRTKNSYTEYKLHLEWRYVDAPPAPGKKRNSGVFLHMTGEDQVWPECIEAQLKANNAGFFVFINGSTCAEIQQATEGKKAKGIDRKVRVMKREAGVEEKPVGQWNAYDIVCKGDTITLTVNGALANTATQCSSTAGMIGLQSEGAQLEFRNIYVEPAE